MPNITSLHVYGLHNSIDLSLEFQPGINILHGVNGSGKTTVLHILANMLGGQYDRFAYLDFKRIILKTDANLVVSVESRNKPLETRHPYTIVVTSSVPDIVDLEILSSEVIEDSRSVSRSEPESEFLASILDRGKDFVPLSVTYFPAFRAVMDAFDMPTTAADYEVYLGDAAEDRYFSTRRRGLNYRSSTIHVRRLFGPFVPPINYPSAEEIDARLSERIRRAALQFSSHSQDILNTAFLGAFRAAINYSPTRVELDRPEAIVEDIRQISERLDKDSLGRIETDSSATKIYEQIRDIVNSNQESSQGSTVSGVLAVYRDALQKIEQEASTVLSPIDRFVSAVNGFLDNKKLVIERSRLIRSRRLVRVEGRDGNSMGLSQLSSGERQLISMLYASTLSSVGGVVLIDEPELSLHIDWQRTLLAEMSKSLQDRQIIVATHSPDIGADFEDRYQELRPTLSGPSSIAESSDDNDTEDLFGLGFDE